MSTNTGRHDKSRINDWIARLTALFCTAVGLIQKGVRSEHMVETLLRALQLFKENRLAGVTSIDVGRSETLPENFRELLSMKIADLAISERAKKYFLADGMWYVGEAYRYTSSAKGRLGRGKKTKAVEEFAEALISMGLPLELDPIKAGWQPPYWNDSKAVKAFNIPVLEGISDKSYAERFHEGKIHYIGQFIALVSRRWWNLFGRDLSEKQRLLTDKVRDMGVHAGMYMPPDWTAPQREPAVWQECRARKNREEAEATERAAQRRAQEAAEVTMAQAMKASPDRRLSFEKLFRRLDSFEWSLRTGNILEQSKFVYVGQLIQCRDQELLRLRNCGRKSLREIQNELAELDLFLGMSPDDPTIASFNIMLKALHAASCNTLLNKALEGVAEGAGKEG